MAPIIMDIYCESSLVTLSLLINVAVVNVLSSYQEGMNSACCETFSCYMEKGQEEIPQWTGGVS